MLRLAVNARGYGLCGLIQTLSRIKRASHHVSFIGTWHQ
jgi:hypothetical protein